MLSLIKFAMPFFVIFSKFMYFSQIHKHKTLQLPFHNRVFLPSAKDFPKAFILRWVLHLRRLLVNFGQKLFFMKGMTFTSSDSIIIWWLQGMKIGYRILVFEVESGFHYIFQSMRFFVNFGESCIFSLVLGNGTITIFAIWTGFYVTQIS